MGMSIRAAFMDLQSRINSLTNLCDGEFVRAAAHISRLSGTINRLLIYGHERGLEGETPDYQAASWRPPEEDLPVRLAPKIPGVQHGEVMKQHPVLKVPVREHDHALSCLHGFINAARDRASAAGLTGDQQKEVEHYVHLAESWIPRMNQVDTHDMLIQYADGILPRVETPTVTPAVAPAVAA